MTDIVLKHEGEPDEIARCKCGAVLQAQPMEHEDQVLERSRFAFAITHRRDGTPIKNLDTKGAFLGIVELGWCERCERHMAVLDSTEDKEYWVSLPKWEKAI